MTSEPKGGNYHAKNGEHLIATPGVPEAQLSQTPQAIQSIKAPISKHVRNIVQPIQESFSSQMEPMKEDE